MHRNNWYDFFNNYNNTWDNSLFWILIYICRFRIEIFAFKRKSFLSKYLSFIY